MNNRAGRLRHLVSLLGPYKGRVALMFVALLLATAAALAPPYLAGKAIDAGIRTKDVGALDLVVAEGTHEQLLAQSERYRQVLAQAMAEEAA